jgi:hypothetical protein
MRLWRRAVTRTQYPRVSARQQQSGVAATDGAKLRRGVLKAYATGELDHATWGELIKPGSDALAPNASRRARRLLNLYYSKVTAAEEGPRTELAALLQGRGYGVHVHATADEARRGSISEPDRVFLRLARKVGRTKGDILMAIDDGGFDTDHKALRGKWWVNPRPDPAMKDIHGYDFQNRTGNLKQNDHWGHSEGFIAHGTHVLGIATRGTHRIKAIGVAHMNSSAFGPEAARYAIARGAKVINISRSLQDEGLVSEMVRIIRDNPKVLFVESAGNSGALVKPEYASRYLAANNLPNLITVAAADPEGLPQAEPRSRTCFGPTITVAAPAKHFSSTYGFFGKEHGGYEYTGATSQAAPFTSNVAAKCMLLAPHLRPTQVKQLLVDTASTASAWQGKVVANGMVNATRVYQLAAMVHLSRGGLTARKAATRIGLRGPERRQLEALVARYVD